jgi:hypothetical protein
MRRRDSWQTDASSLPSFGCSQVERRQAEMSGHMLPTPRFCYRFLASSSAEELASPICSGSKAEDLFRSPTGSALLVWMTKRVSRWGSLLSRAEPSRAFDGGKR